MNKQIGITLSGGGARGVAHLGILQALEEFGVKPSIISGTSAGAVAGAFYAMGFSPKEILEIVKKGQFFSFTNIRFIKPGIFSMKGFENIYSKYFPNNSFSDLKIPLHVAATNILTGEVDYFSEGKLSEALMASSCIPIVFEPIAFNDAIYVDGGVVDNFPTDPIKDKCEILIGSNVNSIRLEKEKMHMNNILDRCVHIALNNSLKQKIDHCQLYLEPPDMSQFSILDLKKIDAVYEYGYAYARSREAEIKTIL